MEVLDNMALSALMLTKSADNLKDKKEEPITPKEVKGDAVYEEMSKGSTGTAVGTHLALESIFTDDIKEKFDPDREITKVDIDKYKYHVWNIYTIVRNLLSAIPYKNKIEIILDKKFSKLLAAEVKNIANCYFLRDCQPILFFPNYDRIYRGINAGKKEGNTKVYEEHMMVHDTLNKFMSEGILNVINNGKGYKIPKLEGKILITTNLPIDLCNRLDMDLLESHTGIIKKKFEFNTKYHPIGDNKLANIPFMEMFLYILGDKNIIKPFDITTRRGLLDLATSCNWSARTTREKVLNDIQRKAIPALRDRINGYRSFY